MATLFLTFHLLFVIGFTLRILLRDDLSPTARLAWFIVLAVLPYIGSASYFLFGEIDIGKGATKRHVKIMDRIHSKAAHLMGTAGDTEHLIDPLYKPAFRYAGSINRFHSVTGNSAELMADAADTNARLIADFDAALSHIHVLYYIWLDDQTGTDVANALIRAVKRGVTCRAMADGLGSRALIGSPLWQKMKDAGVQMAVALPLDKPIRTLLISRIDLRNHRKITVIDSKVTYCGSRNSADPEFLVKAMYAPWVDIMLRFEGSIVAQNEVLFLSDWLQATGDSLDEFSLTANPIKNGFPAQVIADGPTERRGATPQLFSTLMACAQNTLTLSTPYFVPDMTVLEALCSAAHRGVVVTLIFPKANDSWIVAAASRSFYHKLLSAGCTIHEFKGGLLHAKTLTIDGKVTLIGSSNLDLRSFDLNYENNILLQDQGVTHAVRERQEAYLSQSEPVTLDNVVEWPQHRRIWHNVIATIGPVL